MDFQPDNRFKVVKDYQNSFPVLKGRFPTELLTSCRNIHHRRQTLSGATDYPYQGGEYRPETENVKPYRVEANPHHPRYLTSGA